jgi:hypothetical protein
MALTVIHVLPFGVASLCRLPIRVAARLAIAGITIPLRAAGTVCGFAPLSSVCAAGVAIYVLRGKRGSESAPACGATEPRTKDTAATEVAASADDTLLVGTIDCGASTSGSSSTAEIGVGPELDDSPPDPQLLAVEWRNQDPRDTRRNFGWARILRWFTREQKRPLKVEHLGSLEEPARIMHALVEDDEVCIGKGKLRTRVGFVANLVAEAKARLGPVPRREADELRLRREFFLAMKEHGMRGRHILQQIDLAINAVYQLNTVQKQAIALTASEAQRADERVRKYGYESGPAWDRRYSQKPPTRN